MKSLKSIVYSNLQRLALCLVIIILIVFAVFQVILVQSQARDNAESTFLQIEQILAENTAELKAIEADYRDTCLLNAETISYIIEHHPEIIGNVEEFRKLAYMMQVDEIHIFDNTGRIFTGTHPEYYNFTFDSGEQMNFFKPMLEDKSLQLCQDITPNTAEGKLVQYSALWSSDGNFIVQVGMYPNAVLETTKKNELSYIFSLLQGNPGVSLYAINAQTGDVIGSTAGMDNGKNVVQLGFLLADIKSCPKGISVEVNGVNSYGIFEDMNDTIIGYIVSNDRMYKNILMYTLILALCLILIELVFTIVIRKFTEHYIIGSIAQTNEELRSVAEGNLDERAEVKSSLEFFELSNHINHMIHTLLSNTDKMSFVLNRTNMPIGVYEYNSRMKTVRFTEHIPEIFGLDENDMSSLANDCRKMEEFIEKLRQEPVLGMENTYHLTGATEKFIKLEEVTKEGDVLGVAIDVTADMSNLKRAEEERDFDLLTGIYNRRGFERQMDLLFKNHRSLKSGALIMIDSDDMKTVNDTYGHNIGDEYLKRQADILKSFDAPKHIAARIGGDEFVLFIFGYDNDESVLDGISRLRTLQDSEKIKLPDGNDLYLHFSFGHQMIKDSDDYAKLMSAADEYMYTSKRIRKKNNRYE